MKKDILIAKISEFLECAIETASLYILLLENPVIFNTTIDMDKVKQLEFLLSKCLISEYDDERAGGEKSFFAIDPQYSLSALLLNEVWKRDSELHSLDSLKNREDIEDLHYKYLLLEEISVETKKIYKQQLPYMKEIIIVVKGQERIASSIAQQIANVNKNIYAMISPPQLMGEIVWQVVHEKMLAGIHYHRITDFSEIIRHGVEISRIEVEKNREKLFIYRKTSLPEKYYVIDEKKVIFFEKSKNTKRYIKKIQIIKNAGVAMQFLNRYNKVLDDCVRFERLIPMILKYRSRLLDTISDFLNKETIDWLMDVFDYGVFYSKGKYNLDFINSSIMKCKEKNLIKFLDDGEIVVNYCLDDIISTKNCL